jgi:tetratricopeptide (TPR) repeat protein
VRRGEELAGIGRWLLSAGQPDRAIDLLKRAVDKGLPDRLLFRTLWDIALLEKKLGRPHAAIQALTELAGCRNDHRVMALEELAKYYEHGEKNYTMALEFTHQALSFGRSPALDHRRSRLESRVAKSANRRLL